ncbi:DUF3800 domain-containing protein [Rhizosaccharibacter radicis]|uniref:DUF3800 domain-containing protein n=1 Tax=Rhizosaccharibacter radicis TaxID=2782605 RepID=A0ABT1VW10_9PROT|nr:DUF3800 domain-containing protein [Acetobacteraceae bacterium KSS12]
MAYFLFVDESGQDHKASPYEVLAGIAVHDRDMGRLSQEARQLELRHFGRRYAGGENEVKGKVLLKKKVFQHVNLNCLVSPDEVVSLAKAALDDGRNARIRELKALGLAKVAFVKDIFELCHKCHCKVFASIIETDAPNTATTGLRKDYAYLFERFYYYLKDKKDEQGIIVFDELEKSKSHILVDQMHQYFVNTSTGKQRSGKIVPEPFFVHSHLTTGVQFADLAAYVISWGLRLPKMNKPARQELEVFSRQVSGMRVNLQAKRNRQSFWISSFAHISDLRTNMERISELALEEG